MPDLVRDDPQAHQTVRRQAFANLLLILLGQAANGGGRVSLRALSGDALEVTLRDVRTLVRRDDGFAREARDVTLIVGCPQEWPFDRRAPLQPFIIRPNDIALPNSDGRGICVDLQGVLPERLLDVLYDTLRLRHYRLDHCVDWAAAAYVRARQGNFLADPRPLLANDGQASHPSVLEKSTFSLRRSQSERGKPSEADPKPGHLAAPSWAAAALRRALAGIGREMGHTPSSGHRVVDVAAGLLTASVPDVDPPVFLRLAGLHSEAVDAARATYLLVANAQLRNAIGAWHDGPGLLVHERRDPELLVAELMTVSQALRALEQPEVAASYIGLCSPPQGSTDELEPERLSNSTGGSIDEQPTAKEELR